MAFGFDFGAVEALMPDLALPAEVADQVLAYLKARPASGALASKSYAAEDGNFDILRRKPFTRLAMICALLPGLHQRFVDAGMPKQVWLDSIDDIRLRQRLYFERTGKVGLAKGDARWLRHLMSLSFSKLAVCNSSLLRCFIWMRMVSVRILCALVRRRRKNCHPERQC